MAQSSLSSLNAGSQVTRHGYGMLPMYEHMFETKVTTLRTRLVDFDLGVKYIKNSLVVDSIEMETIRSCAAKNKIIVSLGFSENDGNSLYIAQCTIGSDGQIKMKRRKIKPTHMERTIFGDGSGSSLMNVVSTEIGKVGSLACWEHMQPLLKYHTISQGEEIHIAAWPPLSPHSGGPGLWSISAEGETYVGV
jgi:nitrilase